jgi:DnaJ-class molecular chaperone
MNYYVILGIDTDASKAEIKEAYRKLVQKYHPDHFGEDSSPFLRIQEAYQVLSDPARKRQYDQSLARPKPQSKPINNRMTGRYAREPEPLIPDKRSIRHDPISLSRSFETYSPSFDEIFDRLFTNFGQGIRQKSERMEELKVEVTINPDQAASGGTIKLIVPVRIQCPLCYGVGMVGFWECHRCAGVGIVAADIPLIVSYPAGIRSIFSKSLSLNKFGIDNLYLTVNLHVSE